MPRPAGKLGSLARPVRDSGVRACTAWPVSSGPHAAPWRSSWAWATLIWKSSLSVVQGSLRVPSIFQRSPKSKLFHSLRLSASFSNMETGKYSDVASEAVLELFFKKVPSVEFWYRKAHTIIWESYYNPPPPSNHPTHP